MQSIRFRYAFLLASFICGFATGAPAPRNDKPVETEWTLQMRGGWNQETTFRSDGTCSSPQYGKGYWEMDGDAIYFSEQNDTLHYAIIIHWGEMIGTGGPGSVKLTLKLGPKVVE